jgi:hypothetical protein
LRKRKRPNPLPPQTDEGRGEMKKKLGEMKGRGSFVFEMYTNIYKIKTQD